MKQLLLAIIVILIITNCKKKDVEAPNYPNTATTTGQNTSPENYVNGYVLIYKNYSYSVVANDTVYSKSYYANANIYNTPVNILTSIGENVYTGALYCNSDSMFYTSDGYLTYSTPPTPPFVFGFANSSVFGTNTVTVTDSCSNLSKANVFAINTNVSISQNFIFDLTTISVPFSICTIVYQNTNTGQSGMKQASYGDSEILIPASDFVNQANDSAMVTISLLNDNYKTVNGKSILFRSVGFYNKTIKVVP